MALRGSPCVLTSRHSAERLAPGCTESCTHLTSCLYLAYETKTEDRAIPFAITRRRCYSRSRACWWMDPQLMSHLRFKGSLKSIVFASSSTSLCSRDSRLTACLMDLPLCAGLPSPGLVGRRGLPTPEIFDSAASRRRASFLRSLHTPTLALSSDRSSSSTRPTLQVRTIVWPCFTPRPLTAASPRGPSLTLDRFQQPCRRLPSPSLCHPSLLRALRRRSRRGSRLGCRRSLLRSAIVRRWPCLPPPGPNSR